MGSCSGKVSTILFGPEVVEAVAVVRVRVEVTGLKAEAEDMMIEILFL